MMFDITGDQPISRDQALKLFVVLALRIDREASRAKIFHLKTLLAFIMVWSALSVNYKKICALLGMLLCGLVLYVLIEEYRKLEHINQQMRMMIADCETLNEE